MVTRVAEQIADNFEKPGDTDDFHPVMVAMPGDGSDFGVFALPGELLGQGEAGKDILADKIMVPIIDAMGAKMISWTMSAWALELEGMNEADARAAVQLALRNGLANHPNRVERVMVTAISSHDFESQLAEIRRSAIAPPTLGPWEDWKRKGPADQRHVEGRFFEPLQAALRDSSGIVDQRKMAAILRRFGGTTMRPF